MKPVNSINTFALCLFFWMVLVLISLLSSNFDFDKASATSISQEIQDTSVSDDVNKEVRVRIDLEAGSPHIDAGLNVYSELNGVLQSGESFAQLMSRIRVPEAVRQLIINGFSETLDFKMLQPGDKFTVYLDQQEMLDHAVYESGLLDIHILEKNGAGYSASRQAIQLESRTVRLAGKIDSSLYAAFSELNEEPKLIHAFADIFASKIDFNTETRKGDRFELLVEKIYKGDIFVGYGRILVGQYESENNVFNGYYYRSEQTPAGYFDDNGAALGTWFIRSPIPFGRVTSHFSLRRKHPIDGKVKPHLGIDLAAKRGTPVMATADGSVAFVGRKGGFGKTVILKHYGNYQTYYGHLSKYGKGLKTGSRVNQKDIIGYVGSTGVSTGPHLDYRIKHNNVFKNPFGIKFKSKTVLASEELDQFTLTRDKIVELFDKQSEDTVLQVRQMTLSADNSVYFL